MKYAKVALGLPVDTLFDYLIPDNLTPECRAGKRVLIPFAKRTILGYVVKLASVSNVPGIRPLIKIIDPVAVLTKKLLGLTRMVSEYYCCSWGEAIQAALPLGIRKGLPVNIGNIDMDKVIPDGFRVTFLQYTTSQEKNEFYAAEIAGALGRKSSVLILSAEIKSCVKIHNSLRERYAGKVGITYRKQKIKEELAVWEKARNSDIDILVGTRPAVFAPFPDLGLIIVDEEGAYGYKEEQAPYYHARDVALMRAKEEGIPVILSAQVPSLESYYAIKYAKYGLLNPAPEQAAHPKITVVDMKLHSYSGYKGRTMLSAALEDRIHKALSADKKVIIFMNRKGFARYAYCKMCGFMLTCTACSSKLVFYSEEKKLLCNSCGLKKDMVSVCPACGAQYIKYAGFGIEKLINQLNLLFPQAKISRIDKEHQVPDADFQILVATEMIFHRDDIPRANLAAALDMDSALSIVNFRGNEKMFSLLYRLRSLCSDELMVQTRMAERFSGKEFLSLDINKLYDCELKERKALGLPPFMRLAQLNLRAKDPERARKAAFKLYEELNGADKKISVFEPIESTPFKIRGKYRFHILLKAKNPLSFKGFLKKYLKKARHSGIVTVVDIDPQ